jgi:hypothetical protein
LRFPKPATADSAGLPDLGPSGRSVSCEPVKKLRHILFAVLDLDILESLLLDICRLIDREGRDGGPAIDSDTNPLFSDG